MLEPPGPSEDDTYSSNFIGGERAYSKDAEEGMT